MRHAKKVLQFAANEKVSKSADIADKMLKRFAAGELSLLKEFLFNTAIDVRVIEDQTPFNKAVEKVSSRELLEASRPTGRVCTSFDDKDRGVMVHLFHQEQGTELQNSLLAKHSATLLAVTYAALRNKRQTRTAPK